MAAVHLGVIASGALQKKRKKKTKIKKKQNLHTDAGSQVREQCK
jgi:hypothetical protein